MNSREKWYWLNEQSIQFLERGYLLPGTDAKQRVSNIAAKAKSILGENFPNFTAEKFIDYMSRGWYSLSTPVWCNFGLSRGLPISCFSVDIQDSMDDILRASAEVGMLSKYGGGTAGYFGNLRPRGSEIKNNGVSSGSVKFMDIFESVVNTANQGSSRRGSFAAYLPIDHGDIKEFLECRSEGSAIQDLSLGVTIPDGWMEGLLNRDPEKEEIWVKLIKKRFETGYPYIMFEDNVNNHLPKSYRDKGLKIKQSNLCVTGDQMVPTQHGIKTVKELYEMGGDLVLSDGHKQVKSGPMRLIKESAPVYKITLENGLEHTVTEDHEVKIYLGKEGYTMKECKDLKRGDKVCIQKEKGIFGTKSMVEEAYLLGLYQSDGTQTKSNCILDIWEHAFDLIPIIEKYHDNLLLKYDYKQRYSTKGGRFVDNSPKVSNVKKRRLCSQFLKEGLHFEKGYVPSWIFESDEETQWSYVKGLLQADGTVSKGVGLSEPMHLAYSDIKKDFLKDLQILFLNLGLSCSIGLLRAAGKSLLPDGKGGKKYYDTKDCYRLTISNKKGCLEIEKKTGFLTRKGVSIEDKEYRDNTKKSYKVISVDYVGEEPVYCLTVDSDEHVWVCNGVITTNCSEIEEFTNEEKSFTCCLSSMNLLHYDEWKNTDAVEVLTYFLDAVLTDFVKRAKKIKFLEKTVKFAEEHRSIGVGVLGYHSYLQSKNIPFESMEAKLLNSEIFKNLDKKTLKASKLLAEVFGEPKMLEGYGERFTTRVAIAPTTSSSFILGQVSPSIEPLNSNYFLKDLAKGKFPYRNPFLKEVLIAHGKDDESTWHSILMHGGSVQHLKFLTDHEKLVYSTFGEISQLEIVQQAAARQKFIDQSQSLNLMIHPDTPVHEVHSLLTEAWKLGVKTLYYQRSANIAQEVGRELMNCVACE